MCVLFPSCPASEDVPPKVAASNLARTKGGFAAGEKGSLSHS